MAGRLLFILIIFISFQGLEAGSGKIWYDPVRRVDTVDFGLCFAGDSLAENFYVENTDSDSLLIKAQHASYSLFVLEERYFDLDEFQRYNTNDVILGKKDKTIKIVKFISKGSPSELETYPVGLKKCYLWLGLYDKNKYPDGPPHVEDPPTESELAQYDTIRRYVLIARKTVKSIDSYDTLIDFDSVYVNPVNIPEFDWRIKNVGRTTNRIEEEKFVIITPVLPDPEFVITEKYLNKDISPGGLVHWKIKYDPINTDFDSAFIELKYHPDRVNFPDSVEYISAGIRGVGVRQEINLPDAYSPNRTINIRRNSNGPDTIDVGNVSINDGLFEVRGVIENDGTLPFGLLDQYTETVIPGADIEITRLLLQDSVNLQTAQKDTFTVSVKPVEIGPFMFRLVFESNISTRNIYGTPSDARFLQIILKGNATGSKLEFVNDTIDFGNVILNGKLCKPERDTLFILKNTGNESLIIDTMKLEKEGPFIIRPGSFEIPPYSESSNTLIFQSEEDSFENKLIIKTNEGQNGSTRIITILARGEQAGKAVLSMPDIKAKPGRRIEFPIDINGDDVHAANYFHDTIRFDGTLLKYTGYNQINTASEGSHIDIVNNIPGELSISVYSPKGAYFKNKNIFLKLDFNTYLGDRVSFPVTFSNPMFSDGKCIQVLNLSVENGSFSLDSVCGLEYKVYPRNNMLFLLGEPSPNPVGSDMKFEIQVAYKERVEVKLYNSFGENVFTAVEGILPEGRYELKIPVNDLSAGFYYLKMKSGVFRDTKLVSVIR